MNTDNVKLNIINLMFVIPNIQLGGNLNILSAVWQHRLPGVKYVIIINVIAGQYLQLFQL